MNNRTSKIRSTENTQSPRAIQAIQSNDAPMAQLFDRRSEKVLQGKIKALGNASARVKQLHVLKKIVSNQGKTVAGADSAVSITDQAQVSQSKNPAVKPTPPLAQLKKTKMAVTGLTHLVHPLAEEKRGVSGDHLISEKAHWLENEGAEVSEPEIIWIETEQALLSRRGPNQEEFYEEDAQGPAHYVWYPTFGRSQRANGGDNSFIREDTIKIPDNQQTPGKGNKFTTKTDVNLIRIAAESLISDHYPIPMAKSSLGLVFIDDEAAYKLYAIRVALSQVEEDVDQSSEDFQQLVATIASTNALTELGEVHINRVKVGSDGLGTVIHELMHFYGMQTSFIQDICAGQSGGFNEGVTEYFAQKVTTPVGILRSRVYAEEVRQASEIAGLVGEGVLLRAYFLGETQALIDALKRVDRWDNSKNCVLPKKE